jgi:hypothetical protein
LPSPHSVLVIVEGEIGIATGRAISRCAEHYFVFGATHNTTVIPERAKRELGCAIVHPRIHNPCAHVQHQAASRPTSTQGLWIPGLRLTAHPGMTCEGG